MSLAVQLLVRGIILVLMCWQCILLVLGVMLIRHTRMSSVETAILIVLHETCIVRE